jgi:hypothetical protein
MSEEQTDAKIVVSLARMKHARFGILSILNRANLIYN